MNILLYGAGAVGLGLASCLLKAGERVDLIGRKDTVSALQQNGLLAHGVVRRFHRHARFIWRVHGSHRTAASGLRFHTGLHQIIRHAQRSGADRGHPISEKRKDSYRSLPERLGQR